MKSNHLSFIILFLLLSSVAFSVSEIRHLKNLEDHSVIAEVEREMLYAAFNGDYIKMRSLIKDNPGLDLVNIRESKHTMVRDQIYLGDLCWERTPLMLAAKMGKYRAVLELINNGADMHSTSSSRGSGGRRTPLIYAIKWGVLNGDLEGKVVLELIERGVDVNQSCCSNVWNPLMFAIELLYAIQTKYAPNKQFTESTVIRIVDKLREYGANPYEVNRDNYNAIAMVMRPEYVLESIYKKGIKKIHISGSINYSAQQNILSMLQ